MGLILIGFAVIIYPTAIALATAFTSAIGLLFLKKYKNRPKTIIFTCILLGFVLGILIGNHFMIVFCGDMIDFSKLFGSFSPAFITIQ